MGFSGDASGKIVASVARLQDAIRQLRALSKPFLNWAGKAERLSFDVPTLPLFVHERLSTKAIVDILVSHKRDRQQTGICPASREDPEKRKRKESNTI